MSHRITARYGVLAALLIAALSPIAMAAQIPPPSQAQPERFLVMVPHTAADHAKTLAAFVGHSPLRLEDMNWGCKSGDHTGYVILQAPNEEAVRNMLPPSVRANAKVIKLNKFTPEQVHELEQPL